MGGFRPTPQQQAAVEAFTAGAHVVLQAGAGSGKTSTLQLLGEATRRRGRYLAFNKSIATEAQRRFPRTVTASTVHKLGYAAVGHQYRERLTRPRMASAKLASIFGIRFKEVWIGQRRLTAAGVYAQASGTVLRFCQSADAVIRPEHVPWPQGISEEHEHDQLVDLSCRMPNAFGTTCRTRTSGGPGSPTTTARPAGRCEPGLLAIRSGPRSDRTVLGDRGRRRRARP